MGFEKFCYSSHSNFKCFKSDVRRKGGIWASDDVYFSQFRDGYSAVYKPNYPERSPDDCSISYNWQEDRWTYRTPEQFNAEYDEA